MFSIRMEESFLRVRIERDELMRRINLDSTDGRTETTVKDDVATQLSRQKMAYEAQFIEYVSTLF